MSRHQAISSGSPPVKRRLRLLALALGWVLASAAPASHAQELTIATSRAIGSLPLYVAEAQHFFRDAGIDVRLSDCDVGKNCLLNMLQGRAQLATVSDLPIAVQALQRDDFSVLATVTTLNRDGRIVVRRSSGIESAAQLAGKRVATVKGSSMEYFLHASLLLHGVDARRVELLDLPANQVGAALVAGRADAAVIWQPWVFETVNALGSDARVLPDERVYLARFNLVAGRTLAVARQADMVKLLQAVDRGARFAREHPERAQAILLARLKTDRAFIDAAWSDASFGLGLSQALVSTLDRQMQWAIQRAYVPAGSTVPNILRFMEPAPVTKVVPQSVTLVK